MYMLPNHEWSAIQFDVQDMKLEDRLVMKTVNFFWDLHVIKCLAKLNL